MIKALIDLARPLEEINGGVSIRPIGFVKMTLLLFVPAIVIALGLVLAFFEATSDWLVAVVAISGVASIIVASAVCRGMARGLRGHLHDPGARQRAGL